jgi:hypothetical protein
MFPHREQIGLDPPVRHSLPNRVELKAQGRHAGSSHLPVTEVPGQKNYTSLLIRSLSNTVEPYESDSV